MSFQNTTSGWAQDVYAYDDYHSSNGNAVLEPPISGVPYMVAEAVGALDGAALYRWVDTEATLAIQARIRSGPQHRAVQQRLRGTAGLGRDRLCVIERRQPHLAQRQVAGRA
jgi:hypothetical protein